MTTEGGSGGLHHCCRCSISEEEEDTGTILVTVELCRTN